MHRLTHAFALVLTGALGLVLPTILVGADAPSVLVVATLAAAVVAMAYVVVLGGAVLAPAFATVRIDDRTKHRTARRHQVTDPVHHPIRRRAPGRR